MPKAPPKILKKENITPHDIAVQAGNAAADEGHAPVRIDVPRALSMSTGTPVQPLSNGCRAALNGALGFEPPPPAVHEKMGLFSRSNDTDATTAVVPTATTPTTPRKAVTFDKAPAAPPKAPIAKATSPVDAKPRTRGISIRMIKQYLEYFTEKCRPLVPSNYESMSDAQLSKLVDDCDNALGQGLEYETLALAVPAVLGAYEHYAMKFVPKKLPFAHAYGVGELAHQAITQPESQAGQAFPLARAIRRLAIQFTGTFDRGPYTELAYAMGHTVWVLGSMHMKRLPPQESENSPSTWDSQAAAADL